MENKTEKSVMTEEELNILKTNETETVLEEGPKKAPSVKNKREVTKDIDIKFECSFAPMGKSNVSFIHKYFNKETKYNLSLLNKIYILPKDLNENDKIRYRNALKDNGFMDITTIESGAIFNVKKGEYEYRLMHSEHTNRNPINGTISLALLGSNNKPIFHTKGEHKGKQISKQVNIINGLVITNDELVYEALIKAGFCGAGKVLKED